MSELNKSVLVPCALFLATSLWFTRRVKETTSIRQVDVPETDVLSSLNQLTKHEVSSLRSKHFCKAVSLSYANSGTLMIVRGRGSKLMDETGQWYLDTRNNVCHVGHCNQVVVQAVQQQVATLNTNSRYLHANTSKLAERLVKHLHPLEVVFFVNSGTEANDLALRLARAYTGSRNTIVVDGGYHGHSLACLEVSPYKYEHSKEFQLTPVTTGCGVDFASPGHHVYKVTCPNVYRGPHRDETTAGAKYAAYVEGACRYYTSLGEKVGAFLVEGGMSVAGVILPPPSYLQKSVHAVREAGGVYIADEVQTGFGRLGESYWAFQHSAHDEETPVVPDIVTVGKPFGNGMPLAAVITTREIANAFESMGVEYFNTFGGNPVCAAAGLAMLDVMETANLQLRAAKVGHYIKTRFIQLKEAGMDIIGDVRGSGLFLGVELVRNRTTLEPATAETSFLCTVLKQKYAILTSIDGQHSNVLVIKPPMVFDVEDADLLIASFEKAVRDDLSSMEDISSISKTPT